MLLTGQAAWLHRNIARCQPLSGQNLAVMKVRLGQTACSVLFFFLKRAIGGRLSLGPYVRRLLGGGPGHIHTIISKNLGSLSGASDHISEGS